MEVSEGTAAAPRLDAGDVIASPTLCLTPPLMSEVADADSLWVNRRIVRNRVAVNYLGLCAITMPVGCDRAGMPVGLELTASVEGRCTMILPLGALFFDGAGKLIGKPSCQAKQSQCQRAHSMKSAIAKLAVFIGADSRFDLR